MFSNKALLYLLIFGFLLISSKLTAQCGGILEPGFKFLTSSRGCAPYTVNLQTLYLSSIVGTKYFIDWGDGTPEESFVQTNATGVTIAHNYPSGSINCGYDVVIDASNACNPRGSVVPINTQVIVWTNDVVSINPQTFRVCQGFAANLSFTDNSTWNCFPRATRENNEPRWVQFIYGTGSIANQINGVKVNSVNPGSFPYLNPSPTSNPFYPVLSPGFASLPISIPVTAVADIGKDFVVTLKNWNQCNAYDNDLLDGNARNPVSGDLVNGDNPAQMITGKIVIVPSPQPSFVTRLSNSSGPIQTTFCIGDNIFFNDETPPIGGASFKYTWRFFDNATGTGAPLSTSTNSNPTFTYPTGGLKLIRLSVSDANAVGGCVSSVDKVISISPSLVAKISVTDFANNPITPSFCQEVNAPLTNFQVRFNDVSIGVITPTTQWRWEFYNEVGILIRQEPAAGFSSIQLTVLDQAYTNKGIYKVKLRIRDNVTSCESVDEVQIKVYEKPKPIFSTSRVCEGNATVFLESSTLNPVSGESISLREWDFNYDGVTFNKDPAFDNKTSFSRVLGISGTYKVAFRATTNQNACSNILVIPVVVDPLPASSFTPSTTSGCGPLTVDFTNNSIIGQPDVIDKFIWEVDAKDGLGFKVAAIQKPTDPGFTNVFRYRFSNLTSSTLIYDIQLRVVTIHTCERVSGTQVITVFPGTISGFSEINYSPFNSNCSPQIVNFKVDTQTQSLNPIDYTWSISDAAGLIAQSSTATNPNFSYSFSTTANSFKDFSINLTTKLASGCKGDSARTIRISPVPISNFLIDTLLLDCQKMKIRLLAIQKGLSKYNWKVVENGITILNSSNVQDQIIVDFNRSLTNDLPVQFSLETENFAACKSPITSKSIIILKQDNINASFTASPTAQTLPNSTVLISNTTNPGNWKYLWNFGDNTTSTNASTVSHTYATYGSYTISLTVSSAFCVQVTTQTITINPIPPIVNFSYDPPSGCIPVKVTFTNLSKYADVNSFNWDFGDGTTSQQKDPMHVYSRPGTYTVKLSASNITGQLVTESKPNIISAWPQPSAAFDVKPRLVYIPGGILYTKNLSSDANTYEWDFGDGTTSPNVEPEHRYANEGFYTISLKAINQFGCEDTTKLANVVRVKKDGQVLVPNAFSPSGGGSSISGNNSGDGKNDVFLPLMRGVTQFEFLIFNRWGELLFESQDVSRGWDGTYNGKICQQDVYMYKLTARFENGETVVRVGDINLIR